MFSSWNSLQYITKKVFAFFNCVCFSLSFSPALKERCAWQGLGMTSPGLQRGKEDSWRCPGKRWSLKHTEVTWPQCSVTYCPDRQNKHWSCLQYLLNLLMGRTALTPTPRLVSLPVLKAQRLPGCHHAASRLSCRRSFPIGCKMWGDRRSCGLLNIVWAERFRRVSPCLHLCTDMATGAYGDSGTC